MTSRIYKYQLEVMEDLQTAELSVGAAILHVAGQDNKPCFWASTDDDAGLETRTFMVIGTGHMWRKGWSYVGTAHCGPFVWHVLERDA